jgi:mono/diheme cytochrome c family protein
METLKGNGVFRIPMVATLMALSGLGAGAHAQTVPEASRGELLYANHCITCHTTQVHWGRNKVATDLQTLQSAVRRWQAISGLGWSDGDIADVARYLNALHYRFAPAG